jgi:alkaline phosphatase
MKYVKNIIAFAILIFICNYTWAQKYTVANAHAHNDYIHKVPFYTAFDAGFGSIEADIYPVNGVLLVAHGKRDIKVENTLKSLYLDPILNKLAQDSTRHLKLLIDIKENYKLSLQLLLEELKPLNKYLFSPENPVNPITILISGERPPPSEYKNYPSYIFFDDDLRSPHSSEEWKRVGQVSLSFERYSKWKGRDTISSNDKSILKKVVDSVHQSGKTIRFWAAPDTESSWKLQMQLGVDIIGTDQIPELTNFLKEKY